MEIKKNVTLKYVDSLFAKGKKEEMIVKTSTEISDNQGMIE